MKKISLILVSLLMVAGMVMAQNQVRGGGRMNPRETAQEMTDRMVQDFKLDDAQKGQLLEVNQKYLDEAQKRFEAVRGGAGNNNGERPQITQEQRDKMRQEMTAARESYDAQVQKIFTADQFKAYQKKEQENRSRRQQR